MRRCSDRRPADMARFEMGYFPSSIVGIILIVLIVMLLTGRL